MSEQSQPKAAKLNYKWVVLIVISVGMFMAALDEGAVRIILPQLVVDFAARADTVVWAWLIYLLVGAGLVLTLGRLGDAFGRKRVYIGGLILFTIGLTLSAVATGLAQLVAVRALQSIGASMTLAMSIAIVTASFPQQERGRALGVTAAVVSAGLLAGPALGGALIDWLDWRSVFYARIPISLVAIALAVPLLQRDAPAHKQHGFDAPGALTLFFGLACVLVAINRGQSAGWTSPFVVGLAMLGIGLLVGFVMVERKVSSPVLDLSLLSNRVFASANVAHTMFYISTIGLRFGLPFYFVQALALPAATAGLLLGFIEGIRGLVSPFSGRLSDKTGTWVLAGSGMAIVAVGILFMLPLEDDVTMARLIPLLGVVGFGMGLFVAPITSSIMGSVSKTNLGTASAMVATTRQIGSSLGLAIAGTAFTQAQLSRSAELLAQGVPAAAAATQSAVAGFHAVAIAALAFAVVGLVLMLVKRPNLPTATTGQPKA